MRVSTSFHENGSHGLLKTLNRPGSSGGSSPEFGEYLIQDANRCGFWVNRREFESCPVGRIEEPSEGHLLVGQDRMPVLRHHSNGPFPHFGEYLCTLALPPSSQGIASPAIPRRFTSRQTETEAVE